MSFSAVNSPLWYALRDAFNLEGRKITSLVLKMAVDGFVTLELTELAQEGDLTKLRDLKGTLNFVASDQVSDHDLISAAIPDVR